MRPILLAAFFSLAIPATFSAAGDNFWQYNTNPNRNCDAVCKDAGSTAVDLKQVDTTPKAYLCKGATAPHEAGFRPGYTRKETGIQCLVPNQHVSNYFCGCTRLPFERIYALAEPPANFKADHNAWVVNHQKQFCPSACSKFKLSAVDLGQVDVHKQTYLCKGATAPHEPGFRPGYQVIFGGEIGCFVSNQVLMTNYLCGCTVEPFVEMND